MVREIKSFRALEVTAIALFTTSLLMAARGRAEEGKVPLLETIEVEPGVTCLDGLALVEHVRRWLGRDQVDRRVRVAVQGSSESPTEATFFVDKGDGQPASRYFSAGPSQCYDFHSVVGLSIAMAIDAAYLEKNAQIPPPEEETGGIQRIAVSLLGLRTSGVLTGLSWGGFLAFEAGWFEWLDIRLGTIFTYLGDQQLGEGAVPARFETVLVAGRLDFCGAQTVAGAVRFRSCLGTLFGAFRTRGYDYVLAHKDMTQPWGAIALSGEFSILLSENLSINAEVDLVVPCWKRTIGLEVPQESSAGPHDSKKLAGAGLMFGVGPVARF